MYYLSDFSDCMFPPNLIASLDLEKVIQNVDTEELDEFVTPILFCRADSEFDENKIDPGFIKVFKLCQLIGEYLSFSRDKGVEKVITLEARCSLLEEQKVKGDEEAGQLRENLTLAKKELKKTKEMLASTQTQLLGSDNLDEVDQVRTLISVCLCKSSRRWRYK